MGTAPADWRDELPAVIAARAEYPELKDHLTGAFVKRMERAAAPLEPLRPAPLTLFASLRGLITGFLAGVFVLSVLLRTSALAPLAVAGLLMLLLAIASAVKRATVYVLDRRYLREEERWLAKSTRPQLVVRTYGDNRGLQLDANRLSALGYDIAGQCRIWGGTKITYSRRLSLAAQ